MTTKRHAIVAVFALLPLTSCQPQYTLDQTQYYARKIGVTNQFDISRRNSSVIAQSSRMCVVAAPNKKIDMSAVGGVVASGFVPFFEEAFFAGGATSIKAATRMARKKNADFAVLVQVTDTKTFYSGDKPDNTTDYHRLQMLLVIVDANSGNVLDKVQLLARTPHYSVFGRDIKSLLAQPISQIGRDLTGAG